MATPRKPVKRASAARPQRAAPTTAGRRAPARRGAKGTVAAAKGGSDSTKDKIRDVALDVFAERGFEGTSTREICTRAGVNGAALNYHWRSKEQLWVAVCEKCGEWFANVVSKIDIATPPAEAIASFLRLVFDGLMRDPRPIRVVLWASMQPSEKDQDGVAAHFRPFVDFGNVYVRALQAQGIVAKDIDTDVVVMLIHNMLSYTVVNGRGLEKTFGGDFSNPTIAARIREGLVSAALDLLGLSEGGAAPAKGSRRAPK